MLTGKISNNIADTKLMQYFKVKLRYFGSKVVKKVMCITSPPIWTNVDIDVDVRGQPGDAVGINFNFT